MKAEAKPILEAEPGPIDNRRPAWLLPLIAAIVIVGALYVVRALIFGSTHEVTDDAFVTSHVVNISPQVQGVVRQVYVSENQEVKKGQLLVQLDDSGQRAAYDQAKANLDLAIAEAKGAKTNVALAGSTGEAQVQQALGNLDLNRARVDYSQHDYQRVLGSESSTSAQVAAAQAALSGANAGYVSAEANLARAKSGVGGAQADLQTALASARAARADVVAEQANAARAAKEANRQQALVAQGAVSAQSAEAAQAAADSASAGVVSSQEHANAAESVVVQRRLDVEAAEHQLKAAEAAVVQAQAQIKAAAAQVAAAEANASQAKAASKAAKAAIAESQGNAAQAMGVLAQAKTSATQVLLSENAHEQALAKVEQAQAALAAARTVLGYTKIYAASDGRVSKITVATGSLVQPLFPMMSLITGGASDPMWVMGNFKETQLGSLGPGQRAEVEIDGFPGQIFYGKLDSVAGGTGSTFALLPPDNSTGNFTKVVQRVPVKITLDPGQKNLDRLSAGMSATITVSTR